jgi:hypothetical protein
MCDKALFRRVIVVVGVLVCFFHTVAFALYDTAPSWRDKSNSSTTYAVWEFGTSGTAGYGGSYYYDGADSGWNVNDEPGLVVNPLLGWFSTLDGATGVWGLSGHISAVIPNTSVTGADTSKLIQIQLAWKSETVEQNVPTVYVNAEGLCYDVSIANEEIINGWTYTTYFVELATNPTVENIEINGKIYVDSLIIDTYCIPEPATLGMMSAGAAVLYLLRRKIK